MGSQPEREVGGDAATVPAPSGGRRPAAMFRKLKQGLGKGTKAKYRLDVAVTRVEGLPPGVAACRLQWARGAKVAVTKLAPTASGTVTWNEELSQIATLIRLPSGAFEPKDYDFKLQAPSGGQKPPATIGKASLDMAMCAAAGGGGQAVALPVPVPGGRAILHLLVGAAEVKGMAMDDDAMSIMTGASGLSDSTPSGEQDLSGFRMDSSRALSGAALAAAAPPGSAAAAASRAPSSAGPSASISAQPSTAGPDTTISRSSTGGERQQEVEALRKELDSRDARVSSLQRELESAHQQLAAASAAGDGATEAGAVPTADDSRVADLEQQNNSLAREVGQLRSELAAATSSATAAATVAVAGSTMVATDSERLREQLAAVQARVDELEQELAAVGVRRSSSGAGGKEGGGGGSDSEMERALAAAKLEAEEAEAMAQEAMEMAEAAQAEVAELRAEKTALAQELVELQEQTAQALSSSRWKEEREAKREADWDARLKEAYKRMEESVLLAERMQQERDELEDKYAVLLNEKQAVEAKLDPDAMDQQVALEVEAARRVAEAQARIEVEDLQQRLRTMEEYVEEADAKRLAMAGQLGVLERQLAGVRMGEEDSYQQVKAAEDRADGLSLELQYAQSEAQRLAHELALLRGMEERHASDYQRDLGEATSRSDLAWQQLEETRAQLRQESSVANELRSRVLLLEEDIEATKLQLVHAQQVAALATGAGAVFAASGEAPVARARLESDLAERQRAAEERVAQLDAVTKELADARVGLADAEAQRERAESQLAEARRSLAASASAVAGLEATLAAREAQLQQVQEAQRSSLVLLAARGRASSVDEGEVGGTELRGQLEAERSAHAAEVARISSQLAEAQQLAQYSAGEMAGLVQQLAEAQGERSEVATKLAEAREEVSRLRAGPDGELRGRIERLEKEAVIQRNRAEVNALFKEEHDRIAQELVETKLVWAEAQEQLVKLKRSLVKSQEKNVTFSARLTKMETKMYQSFNGTADSMSKGAKKLGTKLSLRRGSKEHEGRRSHLGDSDTPSPLPSPLE